MKLTTWVTKSYFACFHGIIIALNHQGQIQNSTLQRGGLNNKWTCWRLKYKIFISSMLLPPKNMRNTPSPGSTSNQYNVRHIWPPLLTSAISFCRKGTIPATWSQLFWCPECTGCSCTASPYNFSSTTPTLGQTALPVHVFRI